MALYEKLLAHDGNLKAEKEEDIAAVNVVVDDEKRRKIGLIHSSFYAFGTIMLLAMSGFAFSAVAMSDTGTDWMWMVMITIFFWSTRLGSLLLCEIIPYLNCCTLPESIDFIGMATCGFNTWGFYYATELCDSIISENNPGKRLVGAAYMISVDYVFSIISAFMFLGFLLSSCGQLYIFYRDGFGPIRRTIAHPRRGSLAADIYKFLAFAISFIILAPIRGELFPDSS